MNIKRVDEPLNDLLRMPMFRYKTEMKIDILGKFQVGLFYNNYFYCSLSKLTILDRLITTLMLKQN